LIAVPVAGIAVTIDTSCRDHRLYQLCSIEVYLVAAFSWMRIFIGLEFCRKRILLAAQLLHGLDQ
jgi:hypothetical protein